MANAFFLIRLALAGIFGVAGWAKLTDRPGTRQAIRDFGLPESIASLLAWLLPLGEIAVALAVLPVQTAWWGALGALTLLVAFLGGIGASLARGRRPECHCFGQLHSEPVGPGTVARNLVLALLALAVVLAGSTRLGPSAVDWLGELAPGQLVGVIAAGLGLALLALAVRELRALRQQLLRLETVIPVSPPVGDPPTTPEPQVDARPSDSPAVGSVAPSFRLPDLEGNRRSLDDLLAEGKSLLLIFIDAQCGSCNALLPEVGRWQRDDDGLVVAAISRGAPELNRARAAEHGLRLLLLQDDREVSGAYGAPGTPSAVLVAPDGRVASAVAAGAPAIRALVAVAPRPDPVGAGAIHVNGGSPVEHHPNDQPRPASPDPSARPLPRPDLTTAELDGETVVYDPSNGQVHQLNATATLVWSLCDGERSVDDLARLVAESYAIPLDEARGDVAELVAGLLAANLVVIK